MRPAHFLLRCEAPLDGRQATGTWSFWGAWVASVSALALACHGPASAQQNAGEPAAVLDADPLTLLQRLTSEKIDSVSKFSQTRLDAAAMVTVVERAEIEAHGYQTGGDLLRNVPGVYLTHDRSYSAVGARGFNRPGDYNARMLMLVDGQRINDVIYDQALPEFEFPLVAEWVRRMEYVAGPSSSVYGGNALFGVANYVTLNGADVQGTRLHVTGGTRGTARFVGEHGATLAGGQDVFVGVASYRSDGAPVRLSPDITVRGQDGTRYSALLAKYRDGGLKLQVSASQRDKDVGTAPYGTSVGQATQYADQNAFARLSWDSAETDAWQHQWQFSVGHSGFEGRYRFDEVPLLNMDRARADWVTGEAKGTWRGWLNHTIVLGLEARQALQAWQFNGDVDTGTVYLDDDAHRSRAIGAYVQDEYRLTERWALTTGLRMDSVDGQRQQASPRGALLYRPSESQSFKLLMGSAFRAPNLFERYYDDGGASQVANPSLGMEHLDTVEFGMDRAIGDHTRLSTSVYRWRLKDQIEFNDATMRYENISESTTTGWETEIEQQRPSGIAWRASVAWQNARSAGKHLSNSPYWLAKGAGSFPLGQGRSCAIEADAMGPRTTRTGASVAAHAVANLSLRQALAGRQSLTLRVRNLLDDRYEDPVSASLAQDRIAQVGRVVDLTWQADF